MSVAVDSICPTPPFAGVGMGGADGMVGEDDVTLGSFVLTPGFKSHLENYYHKATPEDRVKCLDLLTSLRAYEQNQAHQQSRSQLHHHRRPQTAMAALGASSRNNPDKLLSTYAREYVRRDRPVSGALRPESTDIYGPSSCYTGHPHNESTYHAAFNTKEDDNPSMPIRSGSSSGTRNNNPHPLQAFMVWRYPSKPRKSLQAKLLPVGLADELVDKIHANMCKSTYQVDYLSLKQRQESDRVKMTAGLAPDWKSALPMGLDSVQRTSYRQFRQTDSLQCPTTRYGCNRTKHVPATGSIPTVNRFLLNLKNNTTYERHFNGTAATVVEQAIEHSKNQDAKALLHYYQKATGENKASAGRILMNDYLNVKLPRKPPSSRPQEPSCCYRRPERPVPPTPPSTRSIRSSSDSQATPPTPTSIAVARAAGRFPKPVTSPYSIPDSVRFEE